ncbi:hypothetical protein [Phormidium sp. CCY1219]|nr:hypothetical protein [Phormidium sp. CCY1219]
MNLQELQRSPFCVALGRRKSTRAIATPADISMKDLTGFQGLGE